MNIGQQLSHYIIEDKLGDGGFGEVFRARDINTGVDVAIKCSKPGDAGQLPDQQQRFLREVSCTSKLVHKNIVQVYEYGSLPDGTLYLVMEHVSGANLENLIKKYAPFSFAYSCNLFLQVLDALYEAHSNSIIHRDLKPANIMVVRNDYNPNNDQVKLLDFGIAKAFDGTQPDLTQQFFQNSVGFGTPQYMPPEQFFGKNLGPHTDIYAIALVFYEMLVGKQAFGGKNLRDIIQKQLKSLPEIPFPFNNGPLLEVFRKALAKDPTMRYASASEMSADIQYIQANEPNWVTIYQSASSNIPYISMNTDTCVSQMPQDDPNLSSYNTVIFDSVDDNATQDIRALGMLDNDPTDDMSRLNMAVEDGMPENMPGKPRMSYPQISNKPFASDPSDFSNAQTIDAHAIGGMDTIHDDMQTNDWKAVACPKSDIVNTADFHEQHTTFLQNKLIRQSLTQQKELPLKEVLLRRWRWFIESDFVYRIRASAVGRFFWRQKHRLHKIIDELYEWHFAALVAIICMLIIALSVIIVLIIISKG